MKRGSKGITLIALVITIIVLLILAGVSIATLMGENGLLTRASEARKKTEEAEEKEREKLELLEKEIGRYVGNSENVLGNENTSPSVPEGSSIIENKLEKGIVIKDKNGNEWEWVEVPKEIFTTATTNTEYEKIENDMIAYAIEYRSSGHSDTWINGIGIEEEKYNELKNNMLGKVYTNGGFWISRYEIGTETVRESPSAVLTNPVSKQYSLVYNYVTQAQAQSLASQMKPDENMEGSLMFGIQWDLMMKHIETKGGKSQEEIKIDSTTWGNYNNAEFSIERGKYTINPSSSSVSYTEVNGEYIKQSSTNVLLTTGATNRNKVLNIYDIAGNVWEITLEKYDSSVRVVRGGRYFYSGSTYPVTYRAGYNASDSYDHGGFRVTLI